MKTAKERLSSSFILLLVLVVMGLLIYELADNVREAAGSSVEAVVFE